MVPQRHVKISRVIPHALAATLARVSRDLCVVDVTAAAVVALTAVVDAPIVVEIAAVVLLVRVSNAVPAVAPGTTAVTAAIPGRRAVRNSSPKC